MPSPYDYRDYFREEDDTRQYWGDEAAGCIFVAKETGRILLAHRSDRVGYEPDTWGTWGGKVDPGETPKDAVAREVEEETGFSGTYKINPLYVYRDGEFKYHNYLVIVPHEFTPQLNWENDTSAWVEFGDWPDPLHFGMVELLRHAGDKIKKVVDLTKTKKKDSLLEAMDSTPPAIIQPAPKPASTNTVDQQKMVDAYIVAATLWGEARGEGELGMHAVLNVIMHRAKGDFSKAKKVVLAPKQFSVWNSVANPEEKAQEMAKMHRWKKLKDGPSYIKALELVDKAMNGSLTDVTGGATFYFNPKKANPSWAKKMTKIKSIGNHDFYKPKAKSEHLNENAEAIGMTKQGLVDDGIYGYELRTKHSYLRYGYEPASKIFYLYSIQTPEWEERNKGYAKALLEHFFQIIKQSGGALDNGSFTSSGKAYIKHVVERLSKQYGVQLVNGGHNDQSRDKYNEGEDKEEIMKVGYDPDEESPDMPIDWNAADIQMNRKWDIPTIRSFMGLPKTYQAIYPAVIEVNELDPKLAEDDDDIPEEDRGGYDWSEFGFRRKGFPPVLVRRTSGKLQMLDGNHRVYWAQNHTRYQTIGAWVVDDDIQRHIEGKSV